MEVLKKYWYVLLIGFLLKAVVANISFHPDVKIIEFVSNQVWEKGNLNPYEVIDSEKPDDLPLQYWSFLPFTLLDKPLFNSRLHLLAIKFPLLIYDLLVSWVLLSLTPTGFRKKAAWLWVLNPVSIWVTAAIGQVDIIPVFFVLLSIFLLQKNKSSLAALSLGVGGAIKSFPFLIAPLLIFSQKSWIDRIKTAFLIAIPLLASILPYLPSKAFIRNALLAPQLDKILYARLPLSGGESVYLAIALLIMLYFRFIDRSGEILVYMLISLLAVLGLTHFHPQWFLWVVPLLLIVYSRFTNTQRFSVYLLYISWAATIFLFESSLQVKLFSPIFPSLTQAKGLAEILPGQTLFLLKSLVATSFFAASLYLSLSLFKNSSDGV